MLNCYRFHGRDDLLPTFNEEEEAALQMANGGAAKQVQQQVSVATSAAEAAVAAFQPHFLAATSGNSNCGQAVRKIY